MLTIGAPAAASTSPSDPPPLGAELRLEFHPDSGTRTRIEGVVTVPVAEAILNRYGFYNLELEGEVKVGNRTYDHFAYRFDVPASVRADAPLALAFQRALRPGSFLLDLRVRDVQSGRRARIERPLEVPKLRPLQTEGGARDGGLSGLRTDDPPDAETSPPVLRLLPPPAVATGKQRFEAIPHGGAVAKVTFALDGRLVLARTRPPFSVELDLGSRAVRRTLRAEAFDATGRLLGADEVSLNTGGDGFGVRLLTPPAAQRGAVVTAQVRVWPGNGARVDRVELLLDETSLAVLKRPPYEHAVATGGLGPVLLRAVAYLDDGTHAEDSVLLNAPNAQQVAVDLVELYTTVLDGNGRPVRGLPASRFRVYEEGERQRLDRFDEVAGLPLHAVLVLDTSISMTRRLAEVTRAAQSFLRQIVQPDDEVMVITFDDVPRVRAGFTHDLDFLANGLEGLEARGGTALYDSLVFTLGELQRLRGQRALVLLSDGLDERSHSTVGEVLELARRAAVTIYTIGLEDPNPTTPPLDRPLLDRLADETGGRSFYVDDAGELTSAYAAIEREVRSRYLLAYYSSHAGERDFRLVDVELDEPRLIARTIRGYYP